MNRKIGKISNEEIGLRSKILERFPNLNITFCKDEECDVTCVDIYGINYDESNRINKEINEIAREYSRTINENELENIRIRIIN